MKTPFTFPDYEPPVEPTDWPTTQQILDWMTADDPRGDEWFERKQAFEREAKAAYMRLKVEAMDAWEAASKAAKTKKDKPAKGETDSAPKEPRQAPGLCPAPTLAQIAFYDNGESKPVKGPDGKRKNAKPRFMARLDVWTCDPAAESFNFAKTKTDWSNIFLFTRHYEMGKRLNTLSEAGSISPEYIEQIQQVMADTADRSDQVKIGLMMHNTMGRHFFPHQFMVVEYQHGVVMGGKLYLAADKEPINLVFANKYPDGSSLPSNLRGQCRYDPTGAKPKWATC